MKNNLLSFAAALALAVTTVASAQTIKVKVKVPFGFIVNSATLPAGEYVVQSVDDLGRVLVIRDLNTNTTNLVAFNSCTSLVSASQSKLISSSTAMGTSISSTRSGSRATTLGMNSASVHEKRKWRRISPCGRWC